MRKLVLGMSAAALVATAAFGAEPDNTRLAAVDASNAFARLDKDQDGRVSAIEAASDSKVAAAFTTADRNKDGYLSPAEFVQMMQSSRTSPDSSSAQPRSPATAPPSSDSSRTPPQ
jgi:EF hand